MKSTQKKTIELLLVLGVFGLGFFYFSSLKTGEDAMMEPSTIPYEDIKSINDTQEDTILVNKVYEEGEHKITGTLMVPTPCHEVSTKATVAESYPEQVDVRIYVKDTGGVCAQVLTEKPFEVRFQASELANIQAYLNDNPVEFVE